MPERFMDQEWSLLKTLPWPWQYPLWSQFSRAYQQNRLPQAVLLTGMPGLGKQLFASLMTQLLLCEQPVEAAVADQHPLPCNRCSACLQLQAGGVPGVHWVGVLAKAQVIKVDQIRAVIDLVQRTSDFWRVVVISQAERMTLAAQNGLLKTLEEPGRRSLFILISSQPSRLLPTVRSRCQKMIMRLPDEGELNDWWQARSALELSAVDDDARARVTDSPLDYFDRAGGSVLQAWTSYQKDLNQIPMDSDPLLSRQMRVQWVHDWSGLHCRKIGVSQMVATAMQVSVGVGLAFMQHLLLDLVKWPSVSVEVSPFRLRYAEAHEAYQKIHEFGLNRLFLFECYSQMLLYWQQVQSGVALNVELLWEHIFLSWVQQAWR